MKRAAPSHQNDQNHDEGKTQPLLGEDGLAWERPVFNRPLPQPTEKGREGSNRCSVEERPPGGMSKSFAPGYFSQHVARNGDGHQGSRKINQNRVDVFPGKGWKRQAHFILSFR